MEFTKAEDRAMREDHGVFNESSEESGIENEEILFVHPLPWRTGKVDTLFATLDKTAKEYKSPQALLQMKKRVPAKFRYKGDSTWCQFSQMCCTEFSLNPFEYFHVKH